MAAPAATRGPPATAHSSWTRTARRSRSCTARLHVKADSQLLVEQMKGNYRVKNAGLLPLYGEAKDLVARIGRVTFEHIPREQNKKADMLSNLGMDANG